jgi:hypothetical protein
LLREVVIPEFAHIFLFKGPIFSKDRTFRLRQLAGA